jgi:hypothetical protein
MRSEGKRYPLKSLKLRPWLGAGMEDVNFGKKRKRGGIVYKELDFFSKNPADPLVTGIGSMRFFSPVSAYPAEAHEKSKGFL